MVIGFIIMALLIDGFNLIYKFADLVELMRRGRLTAARQGLLHKLKAFQKVTGEKKICVFLDGKKEESLDIKSEKIGSNLEIYYSLHFSADALIKEFIKKDPNPKMTTVVTSDKSIIDFSLRYKAKVKKSEDFASQIDNELRTEFEERLPEKEIDPVVDEAEVEYWEKIFRKEE